MENINLIYKNKKQNKKKRKLQTLYTIAAFLFVGVFLVSYTLLSASANGNSVKKTLEQKVIQSVRSVNDVWKPNVKMFEDRFVSILVIGVDVREPIFEDGQITSIDGYEDINTDSVIQVVYDTEKNNVFLFSLPRDLGIEYEDDCLLEYNNFHERRSINHIYKFGNMGDCSGGGIEMLKKYVAKITGFPVQYHAMVTFESFIQVIELIGDSNDNGPKGLNINIPEAVYSYYPNEITGDLEYVYFAPGEQFLTAHDLLVYARVRINSSDFERARRQQIVMDAAKEKIFQMDGITNPGTIMAMINSLGEDVIHSDFGMDEIRTGVEMLDAMKHSRVYKVVLDYNLNGENELLTIPSYSYPGTHNVARYYLIPVVWTDEEYENDKYLEVKNYLRSVVENPYIYREVK